MAVSPHQEIAMDLLLIAIAAVAGLVALDLAAMRWGVDSRELLRDDHHR